MLSRAKEILSHSGPFIVLSLSALAGIILLRGYEQFSLLGIFYDLRVLFSLFFLSGILYFSFCFISLKLAVLVHCLFLVLVVSIHYALGNYFLITQRPLGSEIFAYSFDDNMRTITSSFSGFGTFDIIKLLILFFLGCFAWIGSKYSEKIIGKKVRQVFLVLTLIAPFLLFAVVPDPKDFVSTNKLEYFVRKNLENNENTGKSRIATTSAEFPLLKPAMYNDVLGQYFNLTDEKPNIVFLIVEGLGHTVMEKGTYGGFTPFLDSLAHDGLYWRNFLSSSGRTFGVISSLLASLPNWSKGLMSMESSMPHHLSILTLLRDNGYNTRFFHGSNADFDQMRSFFKRHNLDLLVDQFHFSKDAEQAEKDEGGFSWGFSDGALFKRALEAIGTTKQLPTLDVYLTISTHEPFIPPRKDHYLNLFNQKISSMNIPHEIKEEMIKNAPVFSTFMYTDEAIKDFFAEYRKLPSFQNTIFFITGDHRMIPMAEKNGIDRYHVPLIIYSSLLKEAREFPAVSSHLDVVPSLLALLKDRYKMSFPDKDHWAGSGLDTHPEFRSKGTIGFMRAKDAVSDFLMGNQFLSEGMAHELTDGMNLNVVSDNGALTSLKRHMTKYNQVSTYVSENDKIYPTPAQKKEVELTHENLTYDNARKYAFAKDFENARKVCNELLNKNPNDHDTRALLGRTYAWGKDYPKAREIFKDLIERAPNYPDGYAALSYLESWSDNLVEAEALVDKSLALAPDGPEYMILKARLLNRTNRVEEAREMVDRILVKSPAYQEALDLKRNLTPPPKPEGL
ncbi:MAG TPA: sulfatase-like hydrolase/transferase [Bacteriovoracaceae bacterium]|nr:sulfatase-like hydrolase/transferase [Bacteriovoracaceae bacterium]